MTGLNPGSSNHFGRHCHLDAELAGRGALMDVLEPPSVRAELARIGAELTGLHQSP